MMPTKPHLGQRPITPELRQRLSWMLHSESRPVAGAPLWAARSRAGRLTARAPYDRAELLAKVLGGEFVTVALHRPMICSVAEDVAADHLSVVMRIAVQRGCFMSRRGEPVPFFYEVLVYAWDAATYQRIQKVVVAVNRRIKGWNQGGWERVERGALAPGKPGRTRGGATFTYRRAGGGLPIIDI